MKNVYTAVVSIMVVFLSSTALHAEDDSTVFGSLKAKAWAQVFTDSCTVKWQDKWFLDGENAKVSTDRQEMTIDTAKGYAVLWTKRSFEGDLWIEYDFKRLDEHEKGVNIIYIQATGDGQDGCTEDITQWSDRRKNAAMSDYFNNMHTYHISYAAFSNDSNKSETGKKDYVRARRYLPLKSKRLNGTQLKNEYTGTQLFKDKKWIHVTIIKQAKELWVEFKHPDKTLLCHFENEDKPAVNKGRIGLRLMPKRKSQFRNFKIMTTNPTAPDKTNDNYNMDKEKLRMDKLPIEVSDDTWKIFEEIYEISEMPIIFDPTWKNGCVSKNVNAQLSLLPSEFEINITIYNSNVTEMVLAHEALHAKRFVEGYPFFYDYGFPMSKTIANLANNIEHFYITPLLKSRGFGAIKSAQESWGEWNEGVKKHIEEMLDVDIPQYYFNVVGASGILDGLIAGLDVDEMKKEMHPKLIGGVDWGVQIYEALQKYDLSNKEESFSAYKEVASILNLTIPTVTIKIMDFQNRKRYDYDPQTGALLGVQ